RPALRPAVRPFAAGLVLRADLVWRSHTRNVPRVGVRPAPDERRPGLLRNAHAGARLLAPGRARVHWVLLTLRVHSGRLRAASVSLPLPGTRGLHRPNKVV